MLGRAVTGDPRFDHRDRVHRPDRPSRMGGQALARVFIEQGQNAKARAVFGLIEHEIPASHLPHFPRTSPPTLFRTPAHGPPFGRRAYHSFAFTSFKI